MIRLPTFSTLLPALSLVLLTGAMIGVSAVAVADEPPAPSTTSPSTTPSPENAAGRRHNPAFAACKKQADDQKLAAGEARREFVKNCMKSARAAPPSA